MLRKTLPQIVQDNVTDELQGTVSDIGKPSNYIVLYISMYTRTNHNHHNDACAKAAVATPPPPPPSSQQSVSKGCDGHISTDCSCLDKHVKLPQICFARIRLYSMRYPIWQQIPLPPNSLICSPV